MNKIFVVLSVVLLSFSSKIAFTQSETLHEENSRLIVGTWRIDSLSLSPNIMKLNADIRTDIENLIKEKYQNKEISVTADDKKWVASYSVNENVWEISDDGTILTVSSIQKGTSDKSKIILLTEDKFIIEPIDPKSANSVTYMTKVK